MSVGESRDGGSGGSGDGVADGWVALGNGQKAELAHMGRRLAARVIDYFLGACLVVPLGLASVLALFAHLLYGHPNTYGENPPEPVNIGQFELFGDDFFPNMYGPAVLFALYEIVLVYELFAVSVFGKTVGRQWVSIKVVRFDTGEAPNAESFVRWSVLAWPPVLVSAAAALVAWLLPLSRIGVHTAMVFWPGVVMWLIVCLSPLWDADGRGWHDKAARTVVIADPRPQRR